MTQNLGDEVGQFVQADTSLWYPGGDAVVWNEKVVLAAMSNVGDDDNIVIDGSAR